MKWWTVIKNKKLTDKQKKIAEAAEPKHKITGADFKALAEENKKIPQKRSKSRKGGNSAFLARD
tara:strand:+ start:7687 stop:7878 length:192 start_codon:yes stop_codon:yes gene_type:complete